MRWIQVPPVLFYAQDRDPVGKITALRASLPSPVRMPDKPHETLQQLYSPLTDTPILHTSITGLLMNEWVSELGLMNGWINEWLVIIRVIATPRALDATGLRIYPADDPGDHKVGGPLIKFTFQANERYDTAIRWPINFTKECMPNMFCLHCESIFQKM